MRGGELLRAMANVDLSTSRAQLLQLFAPDEIGAKDRMPQIEEQVPQPTHSASTGSDQIHRNFRWTACQQAVNGLCSEAVHVVSTWECRRGLVLIAPFPGVEKFHWPRASSINMILSAINSAACGLCSSSNLARIPSAKGLSWSNLTTKSLS